MLPELTDRLIAVWPDLPIDVPRPRGITYLGVAGRAEGGTTTFLAFGDAGDRPLFVAKIHREREAGERVRREARLLDELRADRPDLATSVPAVLMADRIAGTWVIVETALTGRPMVVRGGASAAALERAVRVARGWLERVHTGAHRVTEGPHLRARLDEFRDMFRLDAVSEAYLRAIDVEAATTCGWFLEHGDLAPHNLLLRDGDIAVIDWTDARSDGLALQDLFFFLATYATRAWASPGARGLDRGFARAFLEDGPARTAVRREVLAHSAAVGVDAQAIGPLLDLFLVERSLEEGHRLRAASARGSWPLVTLHLAAADGIDLGQVAEAQPWIRFFRATAEAGGARLL